MEGGASSAGPGTGGTVDPIVASSSAVKRKVDGKDEDEGGAVSLVSKRPSFGGPKEKEAGQGEGVQVKVNSKSNVVRTMSEVEASETLPNEEEAHPCLFIDTILDVVFKHVMDQPMFLRDVLNIRLVCKTWKTPITRLYRATPQAAITFSEYGYRWRGALPGYLGFTLTEFVEMMRTSDMIPVQKFIFEATAFRQTRALRMFREFLVLCGAELVSLSMCIFPTDAEGILESLRDLPDFQMGKLKVLQFRLMEHYHRRGRRRRAGTKIKIKRKQLHPIAGLMELLLEAAAEGSLRELELSVPPCPSPCPLQEAVLQQLSGVITKGLPSTVKQLKLNVGVGESGFNDLAGIQSKLERVEFNVSVVLETATLYQFLESQAGSLKHLQIRKLPECRNEIFVLFPRLDGLVHLELPKGTFGMTSSANFTVNFPKLEVLDIGRMTAVDEFAALLSDTSKEPLRSLKVLHLPTGRTATVVPLLKDVANTFPCLKELHIGLHHEHKETMEEVFTYFDTLESLHISFYVPVLDWRATLNVNWAESLFSGIAEGDCARIKRRGDFDNENLGLLQRQRRPSLLNLSKLRKLTIENNGGRGLFTITDFTAHFVFMEMDSLRKINLPRSVVQIGPRYRDLLRGKLVLEE